MRKAFTLLCCLFASIQSFSHGVQAAYCVLNTGYIRVYIEHWHGDQTIEMFAGNGMSITTTYGTTTVNGWVNPTGVINNTPIEALPAGTGLVNMYACFSEANLYNDWAYYDFPPAVCNVPVSITFNAAATPVLDEACGDLWPRTINATFNDNAAPVITAPAPVATVPCGTPGANVTFDVTATDNCGPAPAVTTSIPSGAFFPVGTTTVTATATDNNNNTSTVTFPVVVNTTGDNVAPIISNVPSDITVSTDPNLPVCAAYVNWVEPVASDNCATSLSMTRSHQPGAMFPEGTTTVTYTFKDPSNNSKSANFNVTVGRNQAGAAVPNAEGKVYICHNGNTLYVSVNALASHLNHPGDKLGKCNQGCGALSRTAISGIVMDEELNLAVFPNPATSAFNIRIESNAYDAADITVYDLTGRRVEFFPAQPTGKEVAAGRTLAAGTYIVEVRNGDISRKTRVVKL